MFQQRWERYKLLIINPLYIFCNKAFNKSEPTFPRVS